ncbi:transporter [beta proteobacterium AAP121]|nr:transporter [beta proteobacterium AAP65]KPF94114.1 transporter [beta proteobacterium AAP121]
MQPLGALSPRHRTAVLVLWLAALLLAAWQITRTPFVADLSAFLPATADAQQQVLIDQIRSGAPARTLFIGIEGGDTAQRVAASKQLAAKMRAGGRFDQVSNGENDAWAGVGRWMVERRYLLSPAVTPERFTTEGLREGIAETLSLLGTPAGTALKPLLDQDPTGEVQRIAESMIPVKSPRTEDGVWVSRELNGTPPRALLLAGIRGDGADLDGQQAAITSVREGFAAVQTALNAPQLKLLVSGAPVFSVDSRAQIKGEVEWLALTGTLVMSALLLVAFASPLALAAALLPVATGIVAGIVVVSLVFGNVHGVTLGFGATLIGEAVDYAIYYLIQARGQGGTGWRQWLRGNWPTVRLGLLTSLCGFLALLFSGFPGLQQLGVFSLAGLVGAVLTTRFVLPVLMPDGTRGQGLRRPLAVLARGALAVMPRTRWLWLALGLASLVLVWQREGLWQAELSSLSPVSKEALALDASLRADISSGGEGGAFVVVQGPDAETTLQRAEAAATRLETLVNTQAIAGFDSVTRFLPSLQTQRQRQAALPEAAALQEALAEATAGGPLRAERLAPFVQAVTQAQTLPLATPEMARQSALAPLLDVLTLQHPDGRWTVLLPLQPVGETVPLAQIQAALQGLPQTQVLDIGGELGRMYTRYLGEARTQAALGGLGVLLVMALALRQGRRVLAVSQPLLLAVLLCLGGLALLQVPVGILHLVGLLLVVAVGSNYALFFDMLQHGGGSADDDTLSSLLLANVTTVLGFGLIAISDIQALSAIGQVVAPGALLALVLAAAFVPRGPAAAPAPTARPPEGL